MLGCNKVPEMPADPLKGRSLGHDGPAVWIEDDVKPRTLQDLGTTNRQ